MMMEYQYRGRKTVVLLSSSVEPNVGMNVVGHLTLAIGAYMPAGGMGRPFLTDASGLVHTGISRYPVIILKGRAGKVRAALEAARTRPDLLVIDYPREMLTTAHDDELARAVAAKPEAELEYLGIAAHGPTATVDEVFGRFMLWRMD